MITFNLHGELGNQMFEWATGIAFSKINHAEVEFRTLPGVISRMDEFKSAGNFSVTESSPLEIKSKFLSKLARTVNHQFDIGNLQTEVGLNYQELEFNMSRTYHGYFQSWRYFHFLRDSLITEFELASPSKSFGEIKSSLPSSFTGIHIRRGGSGAAILTSDFHGLLDSEYYKRAIELSEKLGCSKDYVVFTDNPDKAMETVNELGLASSRVIGPRDTHSQCENLLLMAQASNFIGANSSYSWWAAYLNQRLVSQPIFPRQWYMDPNISNNDMLLPDWISIGFSKFLNERVNRGLRFE